MQQLEGHGSLERSPALGLATKNVEDKMEAEGLNQAASTQMLGPLLLNLLQTPLLVSLGLGPKAEGIKEHRWGRRLAKHYTFS